MSQNRSNQPAQSQQLQRQQAGGAVSRVVSGTLTRLSDNEETRHLTTYDAEQAVSWIEEASVKGIVVSPSLMPVFPHGRGVAVSIIRITDFNSQGTQLYPIQGSSNLGLHKNVLDDIGRAYGIDWPPEWTSREPFTLPGALQADPRDQDPWCIKITVCGRYKKFDGTWSTLPALTKEIDLREGSAEVEQIRVRQYDKEVGPLPPNATVDARTRAEALAKKKADAEIAQLRKFIRAHAQTKARLQVIGTLVRRSYSKEELQRPFYVFQSVWTGRSTIPEIDMMLAKGSQEMEQQGRAILYGGTGAATPKELPPVSEQPYQADAEMVAYEKAIAEGNGEAAKTENGAQPEAEKVGTKQCAPGKCLGLEPGAVHISECFDAQPEPEPWTITTPGPAWGVKINDPRVTPQVLELLRNHYQREVEKETSEPLQKQQVLEEQRLVEAEIKRRGLFEYAAK